MNTATKLLPGITRVFIKNTIHYKIRFMIQGARIDLGTHLHYQDAVKIMQDWKIKDMMKATNQQDNQFEDLIKEHTEDIVTNGYTQQQLVDWTTTLQSYPAATLDARYDLVTMSGDCIPKLVVSNYLNKLSSDLLAIAPARLPIVQTEASTVDWMTGASNQYQETVASEPTFEELMAMEEAERNKP
jgi:hypothetical protein